MKSRKYSRVARAKYAVRQGKKAYKRGKEGKVTRARKLLVGRNTNGFSGRVRLLGTVGAGVGIYKLGGNIKRTAGNIESISDIAKNTANKVSQDITSITSDAKKSSSSLNRPIQAVTGLFPETRKKAGRYIKKKAAQGQAQRKNIFGFSQATQSKNNLNFMYNTANFSLERLDEALESTLDSIETQYENGELTADEADELEEDALEEYEEIQDELLEEDEECDDESDLEYSVYDGALANFSAGTALGGAIMEHVVASDPEDPESIIVDLAESLGLVDEEGYELEGEEAISGVLDLLSGEALPDESLIEDLADYLDLDEDEVDEIYDLVGEEVEDLLDDEEDYDDEEYYYDENGDIVDELEDEIDELEGELEEVGTLAEEAFSRVANMEANFAEAQEQQDVTRKFELLERDAYSLVESGQMPPVIFEDNYGSFSSAQDQMVAFSRVCDARGVDNDTELYRLEGLNETYSQMEPNINFSQMSYADGITNDYDVDDATLAQATRNVMSRRANNNFGEPLDFGSTTEPGRAVPGAIPSQLEGNLNANMHNLSNHAQPQGTPGALNLGDYARSF